MNQNRSNAPAMSAKKWKTAEVAKKETMSVAKLICDNGQVRERVCVRATIPHTGVAFLRTGIPFSTRNKPEFGSLDVKFQPADHREMLFWIISCVGTPRIL